MSKAVACPTPVGDGGTAAWSSKDKFAVACIQSTSPPGARTVNRRRALSQQERRQEALEAKTQRERIRELERDL